MMPDAKKEAVVLLACETTCVIELIVRDIQVRTLRAAAELSDRHHVGYTRNGVTTANMKPCAPHCLPCQIEYLARQIEDDRGA